MYCKSVLINKLLYLKKKKKKKKKNNFCVSRSRLGGDTENSSCKGAHIMQLSRNLLGLIHVYAQDNRAKYLLGV